MEPYGAKRPGQKCPLTCRPPCDRTNYCPRTHSDSRSHRTCTDTFGVEVTRAGLAVSISGNATPRARDVRVPGDFSSAAAWAVAAAGLPGSEIEIADVGLNPSRTVLLNVLERAGAKVVSEVRSETNCEPSGRLTVAHRTLQPIVISPVEVPSLIDELPLLAALATHRGGGLTLTGASELRNKESDRITALVKGLRTLGANISEQSDGLTVTGDCRLTGGTVDPDADHRLVMAFAIAARRQWTIDYSWRRRSERVVSYIF